MKNKIFVIGMGPGKEELMTKEALYALEQSDVIIGYTVYLKLLGKRFAQKELLSTPMKQETERCVLCFEEAMKGKQVSMICSGDAGIYGMASLMYEVGKDYPEIVDFSVFFHLHNRGIGSKLLDIVEQEAFRIADMVYLAVGVHSGYGTAQRMYVKRGYIPDGSGVWYRGENLAQYAPCCNDDDLLLFLSKSKTK